jgi:hypothetical protein
MGRTPYGGHFRRLCDVAFFSEFAREQFIPASNLSVAPFARMNQKAGTSETS